MISLSTIRTLLGAPAAFLSLIVSSPVLAHVPSGEFELNRFAQMWEGFYSNERQVRREEIAGEPEFPEAVRLNRDMRVHRIDAPQLGRHVLFLEEVKADQPSMAHRQRVMTLEWHPASSEVEVRQLFFKTGPAYDRALLDPAVVAGLTRDAFDTSPGCDLFFRWNADLSRFHGGMRPRACEYRHPVDGPVYAEFDMLLDEERLWYRDRSIIIADGSIRGEIEGFSWLRFDRLADDPALANGDRISRKQLAKRLDWAEGNGVVWEGTFRRVDDKGEILEVRPSRIEVRLLDDGEPLDLHQINILDPGLPTEERIESQMKWDVDRLRFSNDRLDGWAMSIPTQSNARHSVFVMQFKDGSGLDVSEIVTVVEGNPDRRLRATQYMADGKIVRRTLIDEVRRPFPAGETP